VEVKYKIYLFSYHELGTQDLPVMIDYVLNYTEQETLRYIGHSMGTTALFVLLSMKPEYNAKISFAICLAPIAFWSKDLFGINKAPQIKVIKQLN
jgi:predicted alpha/beta hydrolase